MWFQVFLRFVVAYLYTLVMMRHSSLEIPFYDSYTSYVRLRLTLVFGVVLSIFMFEYEIEEYCNKFIKH